MTASDPKPRRLASTSESPTDCDLNCVELLQALKRFIRAAEAFTLPKDGGRTFLVRYAEKALSDAYDEFMPLALGTEITAMKQFAVKSPETPLGTVTVYTVPIGNGGLDPSLATVFELLVGPLAYPVGRHNEENAKRPGGPHQRFRFGDVITDRDWQQILAAERALMVHVDRAHEAASVAREQHAPGRTVPRQIGSGGSKRSAIVPKVTRKRTRAAAPEGWIYLNDATERYDVRRTTLQDWTAGWCNDRKRKDEGSGTMMVLESSLRALLKKKGRAE